MFLEHIARLARHESAPRSVAFSINVILLGVLGYQFAMLAGLIGEDKPAALPEPAVAATQAAIPLSTGVTSEALQEMRLFGESSQAKRQEAVTEAPEARPTLVLRGVIHSTDPQGARAIITESNGRDIAYPLGARLPGGMQLTEIDHRHVVVLSRGREERLHLNVRKESGSGS
ncbi:MAG: type II secretion system protein N [Gammaproteobacteria bacterium]